MSTQIGILHPGQMGASVGAAAVAGGGRVMWSSEGRGKTTRGRAASAGLEGLTSLDALIGASEVLICVCPPAAAMDVARDITERGFAGIYVDANAVAPRTAREIGAIVEAEGGRFVDGGIIGPPAVRAGTTRLYLSGPEREAVAGLFDGTVLEAIGVEGGAGAASALKVCYAAWTKGSAALLVAIRALAVAESVEAPLMREWSLSQRGLEQRSEDAVRKNAFKAWRFAGEMREIAQSFGTEGLPPGFHEAAADVYERLTGFKDCDPPPGVQEAVDAILSEPD